MDRDTPPVTYSLLDRVCILVVGASIFLTGAFWIAVVFALAIMLGNTA